MRVTESQPNRCRTELRELWDVSPCRLAAIVMPTGCYRHADWLLSLPQLWDMEQAMLIGNYVCVICLCHKSDRLTASTRRTGSGRRRVSEGVVAGRGLFPDGPSVTVSLGFYTINVNRATRIFLKSHIMTYGEGRLQNGRGGGM